MSKYIVWMFVHLGTWCLMLLAAGGLGSFFLRRQRFHSFVEWTVFTVALGLGLCGLILFTLGVLGLLSPTVLWPLTVLGATLAIARVAQVYKHRGIPSLLQWKEHSKAHRLIIALILLLAFSYWGLLLLTTQYPPVHWDAIANHLVLVRKFLIEHRLVAHTGIPQPILPALNHLLFTWAMGLKDDILAQMIEHTFMMLTALGLYAWGKRQKRSLLGLAAAAFWLGHPLVLWLGESALVDMSLACFAFLGVYALRNFWDHRIAFWWYLGVALLAMAASCKMLGLFFLGVGAGLGLLAWLRSNTGWKRVIQLSSRRAKAVANGEVFIERNMSSSNTERTSAESSDTVDTPWMNDRVQIHTREPQASGATVNTAAGFVLKQLIRGWVLGVLIVMPWYGFITYYTGSPVWPILPQYSRGIWADPTVINNFNEFISHPVGVPKTPANFVLLPIHITAHPEKFEADDNRPLFILLIVWPLTWIIAFWNRSVRWWVLWALAYTAFWFVSGQFLRYWVPALPLIGLALCESIRWVIQKLSKSVSFHSAVWIGITLWAVWIGTHIAFAELETKKLPPVDREARIQFLRNFRLGYKAVEYVNEHTDQSDTVYSINGTTLNYFFKAQVIDSSGALQRVTLPRFRWPDDYRWMQWLESQNVSWIVVNYGGLSLPQESPVAHPYWPNYEIVYADRLTYVFHRLSAPPEVDLEPAAAMGQGYEGYLDGTDCDGVYGWVWDPSHPDDPIMVDIYDGDISLATVPANGFRKDLSSAGKGNGYHAYGFITPPSLKDGKPHSIWVRVSGTGFQLGSTPREMICTQQIEASP